VYVVRVPIRLGGRKKYEPPRESAESLVERVTCSVLSSRPPSFRAALKSSLLAHASPATGWTFDDAGRAQLCGQLLRQRTEAHRQGV
jgi:hypothetical protein